MVYDGAPSVHLGLVATAAAERLRSRYRCLYLNSPTMVAGFRMRLALEGVDAATEVSRGALVLSSDQDHLIGGEFDAWRMLSKLSETLDHALDDGYAGLWASGDMLWEFGNEKNFSKLLEYELGLEELLRRRPELCGICQYHRETLPSQAVQIALYTHRSLYVNETFTRINPHYLKAVTLQNSGPLDGAIRVQAMLDAAAGD
jgi:hypothetical protein